MRRTAAAVAAACDYWNGNTFGFGFADDGDVRRLRRLAPRSGSDPADDAWSVFASYEHFWTPSLRTSLYGSYVGSLAHCGSAMPSCAPAQAVRHQRLRARSRATRTGRSWTVGSRSQWNVTKDLYVGLDVIYSKLNTASINGGWPFTLGAAADATGRPSGSTRRPTRTRFRSPGVSTATSFLDDRWIALRTKKTTAPGGKLPGVLIPECHRAEIPMQRKASRRPVTLQYYLWANEQAYRIPHRLHLKILDRKARLLRYAGTAQRIIEAAVVNRGPDRSPRVQLRFTTYVFDRNGCFDLGDQADALQGILGAKNRGNVVDVQDVLAGRRWTAVHQWTAPKAAVEMVLSDIEPNKTAKQSRPLPILKVDGYPPGSSRN